MKISADNRYKYPFYTLFHPFEGFSEMKYYNTTSIRLSLIIFIGFALLDVVEQQLTGLQFSMADRDRVNIVLAISARLTILLLWTTANWSICVLMDGKAKYAEIWTITCYSLLPFVIIGYINVILSNILTAQEGVFISIFSGFSILWSIILIISAFINFHEYSFSKTIGALVLTITGMLIIIFLLFLLYSLFQQISQTFITIFNEIIFRIRLGS
jgi:hypothetical protein